MSASVLSEIEKRTEDPIVEPRPVPRQPTDLRRIPILCLGWFLQVWAVISLIAILYIVLVPPPTESTRDVVKSKHQEIVSNVGRCDGLFRIGVFFLGRWMVRGNKRKDVEQHARQVSSEGPPTPPPNEPSA
jgi:hypothetical protein